MVVSGEATAIQETQAPSLELIIAKTVGSLLRVHHLNRDVIIGWIGPRGGGKSVGAATTGAIDWGCEGDVIRSNMSVAWDIEVNENVAALYGASPGVVHYESKELNKHKLLTFHPDYFRDVFIIDEINEWLADARRTMSTQNLLADDVAQMLRKNESPLFYTCIHEMFVDSRIRDMTDLFIKTEDTALTEHGLRNKQQQGIKFRWMLYFMSKKFTGHTYSETNKPVGPIDINGRMLWDIINTRQRQAREKYRPEDYAEELPIDISSDPQIVKEISKWGWLTDALLTLHNNGVKDMEDIELWEYLRLKERNISPSVVGVKLRELNIIKYPGRPGRSNYPIEDFDLSNFRDKKEYRIAVE